MTTHQVVKKKVDIVGITEGQRKIELEKKRIKLAARKWEFVEYHDHGMMSSFALFNVPKEVDQQERLIKIGIGAAAVIIFFLFIAIIRSDKDHGQVNQNVSVTSASESKSTTTSNAVADKYVSESTGKVWIIVDGNSNGVVVMAVENPAPDLASPEQSMKELESKSSHAPGSNKDANAGILITENDLAILAQYQNENSAPEYSGLYDDKEKLAKIAKKLSVSLSRLRGAIIASLVIENGIEKGTLVDKRTATTLLTTDSYQEIIKSASYRNLSAKELFNLIQNKEGMLRESYQLTYESIVNNKMTVTNPIADAWNKFSAKWNRELNELRQYGLSDKPALVQYVSAMSDYWRLMDNQVTKGAVIAKEDVTKLESVIATSKNASAKLVGE